MLMKMKKMSMKKQFLWIDLKDRLSQGNTPRLFKLQKEISHLSQGSLK